MSIEIIIIMFYNSPSSIAASGPCFVPEAACGWEIPDEQVMALAPKLLAKSFNGDIVKERWT